MKIFTCEQPVLTNDRGDSIETFQNPYREARCPISSRASKASWRSRPRSPNPTRKAAHSATGAWTSRNSLATCPSSTSGGCSSTTRSPRGCRPPSRWTSRSAPATSGWTRRAAPRRLASAGACARCSTSQRCTITAATARAAGRPPVPQRYVDEAKTAAEAFLVRWRGEPDPRHVKALDAYWVSAAEHGMNASTFTARVIASTGADVAAALSGAVGALSGPLHGGAPARVLHMIEEVERTGDAEGYVKSVLDSHGRLMGFGHRVYRAEDPRARVLRRTAKELGAPRYEVALALEKAALAELRARRPDRVLETNVEFWAAIVLDSAEVPAHMFTSMFTCARTAGWAAHILEQKRTGRLVRPAARYIGPATRSVRDVPGADEVLGQQVLAPAEPAGKLRQ